MLSSEIVYMSSVSTITCRFRINTKKMFGSTFVLRGRDDIKHEKNPINIETLQI